KYAVSPGRMMAISAISNDQPDLVLYRVDVQLTTPRMRTRTRRPDPARSLGNRAGDLTPNGPSGCACHAAGARRTPAQVWNARAPNSVLQVSPFSPRICKLDGGMHALKRHRRTGHKKAPGTR